VHVLRTLRVDDKVNITTNKYFQSTLGQFKLQLVY